MASRLERFKRAAVEQNQPRRVIKLTKTQATAVNFQAWLEVVKEVAPSDKSYKFTIYTNDVDADFDSMIFKEYPESDILDVSGNPGHTKSVLKASEPYPNVKLENFSDNKVSISPGSLVIVVIDDQDFLQDLKKILKLKKSKVILFSRKAIEGFEGIDFEDGSAVYLLNTEADLKIIPPVIDPKMEPGPSSSGPIEVVQSRKVKDSSVKLPEMPNFPKSRFIKADPSDQEWINAYQNHIRSLLTTLVVNESETNLLNSLLVPTAMNGEINPMLIWILAVTHESYQPDPTSNYDQLEATGDAALKLAFKDFLTHSIPDIKDSELNEYTSRYMSGEFQIPLGEKMHLIDWVITEPGVTATVKINEDLFESFCGALIRIGDLIKPGLGYVLVRSFIGKLFEGFEFDKQLSMGKDTTILEQAYVSQRWGPGNKFNITQENVNGEWVTTYELSTPEFIKYLRTEASINGTVFSSNGISVTEKHHSKDVSKDRAATAFINRLDNLGVTREILTNKDLRRTTDYRDNEYFRDLVDRAYTKATRSGIVRIYMYEPKNLKENNFFMLLGVNEDGITAKLETGSYSNIGRKNDAVTNLLEQYISK